MPRRSDRDAFYALLGELEGRIRGRRHLGDCQGRMPWPQRGDYFFFEPGEHREVASSRRRVVRVGTHALPPKPGYNRCFRYRRTMTADGG